MSELGVSWTVIVILVALVAIGLVATMVLSRVPSARSRRQTPTEKAPIPIPAESQDVDDSSRPRAAIVVNPTKLDDVAASRREITQMCRQLGWAQPHWLETTPDDPGTGPAKRALETGADVVCALGGDGTVRAVSAALVGSGVPLGLLPAGTGNLLARNLGLPVESLDDCLRIALTGRFKSVDCGTLNVVIPGNSQETPKDYVFLVMAGIGFDATVIAEAPEALKAKMGAGAYVVSGMRNLYGPRFAVDLQFDDKPVFHRRVRSVIVGNCGKLQGGLELLPDAEVDDGWLDVVLLSPKGVVGWAAVLARVMTKRRHGHERIDHHRCRKVVMKLSHAEEVQLDGDLIGPGAILSASVEPGGLVVRVA